MTPSDFDPSRYWEDRLSARYTLGSTGWTSLGEGFNRLSYAVRWVLFRRLGRDALRGKPSPKVLDVGSGTGFYLRLWRQLGAADITGCDLTSAAVERLGRRFPHAHIYKVDIGDDSVSLPAGEFDAVSIIDVLYHIIDDERYERAIRNLAAALAPDGVLILSENFVSEEHRGEHQVSRTQAQIDRITAGAGLSKVAEHPVFFLMNTPVASSSRLLWSWWNLLMKVISKHDAVGWVVGGSLLPVEVLLGSLLPTGPSTKMAVYRRSSAGS